MTLRPRTLFRKLFLGTVLLLVLVLGACAWLIVRQVDRFRADELTDHLKAQAMVIRHAVLDKFDREHAAELDRFAKHLGSAEQVGARITMILADGTVLADSEANPLEMESHATRREVQAALTRGWGEDTHPSRTVSREMKYVAVRVGSAESPVGVVRVSMALSTIAQHRETIQKLIWTIMLLGLLAAIVFAMGLARLWSNPIRRITATARSLSAGDLSARARVTGNDEMALLGRSLNEMRDHLTDHLQTIDRQRRTLESLLTQLHEGVVVAGPDGRILLINPAAVRLLGLSSRDAQESGGLVGIAVEQCVSQHELQRMLLRAPSDTDIAAAQTHSISTEHAVQEVRTQADDENAELTLLARAADIVLPGFEEQEGPSEPHRRRFVGRMLVLTDVTELNRTVQVKVDFASNASHELRTPLSAIRAAIETLTNMDLAEDSESARHFLGMIDRHSGRMEQMVSDLLDLSQIESSPSRFKPQPLNLPDLLGDFHTRYLDRLEAKQLQWIIDVQPDLSMMEANPYLLRIVLDNLVNNAIKFTDVGGRISISCQRPTDGGTDGGDVSIVVADNGCGIAEHEQDRVFERFYQVEKARSGGDRGTGLGLSIVRHAVAAMNGTVDLVSRSGEGTRVTITIPQSG